MTMNFLPGPVYVSAEIAECFLEFPCSHRSDKFITLLHDTKKALQILTNAKNLEIVCGSGTLANDIVGHQLSCIPGKGLILSSGEFGSRLADHARRINLDFTEYSAAFGQIVNLESIAVDPETKWLWTVHCETSTGCIYDLVMLKAFARKHHLYLAIDCISSIGMMDCDLSGVDFATATSGKGLGSLAGLGIVFYEKVISNHQKSIPRYLDLGYYAAANGIPFTLSWNQVKALLTATCNVIKTNKPVITKTLDKILRKLLHKIGISILSSTDCAAPGIVTIILNESYSSLKIGQSLENLGITVHYHNKYLLKNNWLQICLMNEHTEKSINTLVSAIQKLLNHATVG